MADPADGVIERLRRRERLMATLVGENPQSRTEKPLYKRVQYPQSSSNWRRWYRLWSYKGVENIEGGCKRGHVTGNISKTTDTGAFEAVGWDCVPNLLDGEIWNLELVAVCVQKHSARVLHLSFIDGSERG